MKKTITFIAFLGVCLWTSSLQAQNFNTCDRWGSWQVNGYTLYNNIWGSGGGTQCLWAYSQSNWGVTANHPNTGGIKSYPNVDRDVNYTVSSMPDITANFNVSRPSGGSYNTAFDIWYNNYSYEIMLWMNWAGDMGPISYNYGCGGYPSTACPIATNINVGGHTWNLYRGTNGSATVYSFLRTSNTNSGTVNITQISKWLANNGYFSQNTNLHEIQFGFEITSTSGSANFTVNSYGVNIGSGGGGGTSYVKLQNRATGLFIDGMGRTSNGSVCGQGSNSSSYNQQWVVEPTGSYVKLRNRATGLYLDGMGRTSNGSDAGQWGSSSSNNQQWVQVTSGGYTRFRNRATNLYLDGMGRSSNGSNLGQWSNSSSQNQQWTVVNISARMAVADELEEAVSSMKIYPNPAKDMLNISLPTDFPQGKIVVYNSLGKMLMTREAESDATTIDISELKAGVYIIKAIKGDRIVTRRFTKL